jgi:hypothetical protein
MKKMTTSCMDVSVCFDNDTIVNSLEIKNENDMTMSIE